MKNTNQNGIYRTTLNTDIAKAYAKHGCKDCYGRGLLKYSSPQGEEYSAYCSCVEKNIRKQKL